MGFSDSINAGVNMRNSRQQIAMEQQRNNLALAQFSEQQQERIKKETDAAKSADYFFKANPEGLTALGETPESFKNKSAGERFSAMVAYGQAMVERERQAKQQAQARDMAALQSFQRSARNVTTPMQIPAGTFGYGVQGGRLAPSGAETVGGQPLNRSTAVELALRSGVNPNALRDIAGSFGDSEGAPFFNQGDVGNLKPITGAPGYGIAVTGPRQSQVLYTGGPQGSSVAVPGVGDVGVITTKPGQSTIVPGQQTQGQVREALAKTEADIAKLRTKIKGDPEMEKYLAGALAEQESLASSYRQALGTAATAGDGGQGKGGPAVGTVMGGYRFKGGDPNQKDNWELVK